MARNTKPISAKNTSVTVRLAAVNRGLRKKRTSSIGCSTRRSQATKAVSASTATANAPRIGALVQPSLGASMMPQTSATSPTIESPAPVQSIGSACGLRELGTRKRPAMSAPITIGTFTKNTDPHQKCSRRKPPATGPSAMAMPATPDQMPIAMARSRGTVKTLVMIESVAGMISAAPSPITARAPTSWLTPPEKAAAPDATPKITRPMVSAPLRPNRSPSAPKVRRKPANTSVYESTTHCSPVMLVPRSFWRVGSATLTMVLSITITRRLTQSTARVSHRRSYPTSG